MERTYKCPVCGKEFTDLGDLRACITADEMKIKKAEAEAEAARKRAKEAELAIQKKRYIDSIKESRASVEKAYGTLKIMVDAYNRLVTEAKQKTGIDAAFAKSTLTFSGLWGTFDKESDFSKEVREAAERVISKVNKEIRNYETSNNNNDDLATIIFKNLGF